MEKKDVHLTHPISFKEQTPEMLIEQKEPDPMYRKAFLAPEPETDNEYSRNTTTWD